MTALRLAMTRALGAAALAAASMMPLAAPVLAQQAPTVTLRTPATVERIRARGELICGSSPGLAGFALPDNRGVWRGFDADYCRAIATAVLSDPAKVRFVPTTAQSRFSLLQAGEIDVLLRNTSWTLTRDISLGLDFAAINFYDGQGFMARTRTGIRSLTELQNTRVCVQPDTTNAENLVDWARISGVRYVQVAAPRLEDLRNALTRDECDVATTDISGLAALRATLPRPGDFYILPTVITKEPLGPMTRTGDQAFTDLVRWTHFGLLAAEELGITQSTVVQVAQNDTRPEVQRMLGRTGGLGRMLGVEDGWLINVIRAVGNYGEIYERNLAPIGLSRGPNELWTNGGLQYSPPFR